MLCRDGDDRHFSNCSQLTEPDYRLTYGGVAHSTPLPEPQAPAPAQLSASSVSTCAVPAAGEPLNSQGCALLQGVEFEGDTTTLMPVGETLLLRVYSWRKASMSSA